jgi:hypothetical protein
MFVVTSASLVCSTTLPLLSIAQSTCPQQGCARQQSQQQQ